MASNQSLFFSSFAFMWLLSLLVINLLQVVNGYSLCSLKHVNDTDPANLSSEGYLDVRVETIKKDGVNKLYYYVVHVKDSKDRGSSGKWPYHPIYWDSDRGLILDPNKALKNDSNVKIREHLIKEQVEKMSTLRHLFLINETESGGYDIFFLRRDPFVYGLQVANFKNDTYSISDDDFSIVWNTQLHILNFTSKQIGSQFFYNGSLYLNQTLYWNQTAAIVNNPNNTCSKKWNGDYIELGNAGGYEVRWYNDGIVRFYKDSECDFRYHLDHQIDENTRIIYRQPIIKTPDCQ